MRDSVLHAEAIRACQALADAEHEQAAAYEASDLFDSTLPTPAQVKANEAHKHAFTTARHALRRLDGTEDVIALLLAGLDSAQLHCLAAAIEELAQCPEARISREVPR